MNGNLLRKREDLNERNGDYVYKELSLDNSINSDKNIASKIVYITKSDIDKNEITEESSFRSDIDYYHHQRPIIPSNRQIINQKNNILMQRYNSEKGDLINYYSKPQRIIPLYHQENNNSKIVNQIRKISKPNYIYQNYPQTPSIQSWNDYERMPPTNKIHYLSSKRKRNENYNRYDHNMYRVMSSNQDMYKQRGYNVSPSCPYPYPYPNHRTRGIHPNNLRLQYQNYDVPSPSSYYNNLSFEEFEGYQGDNMDTIESPYMDIFDNYCPETNNKNVIKIPIKMKEGTRRPSEIITEDDNSTEKEKTKEG